jgi:benzoyl-CoA reductase subunit C
MELEQINALSMEELLTKCEAVCLDFNFTTVREWKAENPGQKAMGFLPTYVPRELIHAAGMLPVGVLGADDSLEIVRGDACFQSYICHLPRSVVELGMTGRLDCIDGMLFPSTCDVIRNLSGIWKMQFPDKLSLYFDAPQNFDMDIGGKFYRVVLDEIWAHMLKLNGSTATNDDLLASIALYNLNRRLCAEVYDMRAARPWVATASEVYILMRAGMLLPVEQHNVYLARYLELAEAETKAGNRREMDNARVVISGSFCEQPPLALVRTLERAGCYVVEDDYMMITRWLGCGVPVEGDALHNLVQSYMDYKGESAAKFVPDGCKKGTELIGRIGSTNAEGVLFSAPSFCDPALLDQPMLQEALDRVGISHTAFKYSENTGQLQPIRERAGTFADTIKLWGEA